MRAWIGILGCAFALPAIAEKVTFYEDIAPIVHKQCTQCHRKGEPGPFNLISYRDVARRAKTISRVMHDRYMPPWQPVKGHGAFKHERRLTDGELALFDLWIDGGKLEGDASKMPAMPKFPEGWQLGPPDLVVKMPEAFTVPADGPDIYRNFVIPVDLPADKWIKAMELRPSSRSVVHHCILVLDNTGSARAADERDPRPGFKGMGFRRTGSLGGYVPGTTPQYWPGDLATPFERGSDVVLQMHFHPTGKQEVEQSLLGLYFAGKPPTRTLVPVQVPPAFGITMGIEVPAGEKEYRVTDTFTLPVDVEAVQVGGHAHYICKNMKMTANLPDGTERSMLYIDDWDLNWQDSYQYRKAVTLPAGTRLTTTLVYDNSEDNPENPFTPPRLIKWGKESTDEMGSITLTVVPVREADVKTLQEALKQHRRESGQQLLAKKVGEGIEKWQDQRAGTRNGRLLDRLDKNGDRRLQKSEVPERWMRVFSRLDADGDGVLEPEELRALRR